MVVILPSCLFHIGNTQRELDLLNLPPPSCSCNPGSENLFALRTKQSMGAPQQQKAAASTRMSVEPRAVTTPRKKVPAAASPKARSVNETSGGGLSMQIAND